MSNFLYMAKQPIFDKEQNIFGYELYYRKDDKAMSLPEKRLATASVLVNALNQMGLRSLVGDALAFVNIDAKILLTDIIYTIPKERFVLELNEDIIINQKEYECIKALHKEGYTFALDNLVFTQEHLANIERILEHVDYIKIDTLETDFELLKERIMLLEGKKLMAQKIESIYVHSAYKDLGFDYFQGYYLGEPELIKKNRIDPHHLGVIRLFNLLQSTEDMRDICSEFEQHNEIMLQLLQFVNSGGFAFETTPKSACDVLEFIGKKSLMQWLMLIVYAKSGRTGDEDINPTSILVQNRIDLMLGILKRQGKDTEENITKARFISLLSLLETVFEMPLNVILDELDAEEEIKEALLNQEGELGELYALTVALEQADKEQAEKLLLAYGLQAEDTWHIIDEHLGHPDPIVR